MRGISLGVVLLALFAGCGPDAPRDNPYDVTQTGVYGTTYRRNGGVLPAVVITVSPANVTTRSDAQGGYTLDLPPGSRQTITFSRYDRQTVSDVVDVPERSALLHNVILKGQIMVDTALVRTVLEVSETGGSYYYIEPYLVAHHPDNRDSLDLFDYACTIDSAAFAPVLSSNRDETTKAYTWKIDAVGGVSGANFPAFIVGLRTQFLVSSSNYTQLINRFVPAFLEPAPYNLAYVPPDTLRWINGRFDTDIMVEVWNGASRVWSRDTSNIEQLVTGGPPAGNRWYVIQHDRFGNRSSTVAYFTKHKSK